MYKTDMDLWVARLAPYAANLVKEALVHFSVDENKSQGALLFLKGLAAVNEPAF